MRRNSRVCLKGTRGQKGGQSHNAVNVPPRDGESQPAGRGARGACAVGPRHRAQEGAPRPPPPPLALRRGRARAWGRARASPRSTPARSLRREGDAHHRRGWAPRRVAGSRLPGDDGGAAAAAGTGAAAAAVAPPLLRRLRPGPPAGRAGDGATDVPRAPPPPSPSPPPPHLPRAPGARGLRRLSLLAPRRGPFSPERLGAPLPGGVGTRAAAGGRAGGRPAQAAPRMKCKPNQTRTYDPEGFKKRAACLCFRSEREDEVLLVSSSRYPDRWIVPGGGMEPEEEPGGAAVREVYEEAGVKGKLGRLLGIFEQNQDRKHRTYVYVLTVTEILEDWEDSVSIGRKREWFKIEDAIKVLQCHKPVHAEYLEKLKLGGSSTNGNSVAPSLPESAP